jgi:transposase
MIHADKRHAAQTLGASGRSKKEISRLLNISPKSVRRLLKNSGAVPPPRQDKIAVSEELLRKTYVACGGFRQRIYEVLTEEHGVKIGYSTLTRLLRESGIGRKHQHRYAHVEDVPGAEMQHDTSPHRVKLGNETVLVQCSSLYLRYSKIRYIQFYRSFTRWRMKCFFHEALSHWEYAARTCIIDNTNLAVLHGTGKNAVIHPEMLAFAKPYGFAWQAHEKGHANRKAGCERSFWTAETNFLPGRTFTSLEDLNQQALAWSERFAQRPHAKTRLVPRELFESEKADLFKLPDALQAPYQPHQRVLDAHGYFAFDGNYYWAPEEPGMLPGSKVDLLQYAREIKIFPFGLSSGRGALSYPLPALGTKNKRFAPEGAVLNPYVPRQFKQNSQEEEKRLRAMDPLCGEYLDFIQKASEVRQKSKFIRDLYGLSQKMSKDLLLTTLSRALRYKVSSLEALQRISRQLLQAEGADVEETSALTQDYEQREAFKAGRFSQEQDLTDWLAPQPDSDQEEPSDE